MYLKPQIVKAKFYEIETTEGTEWVPFEAVGEIETNLSPESSYHPLHLYTLNQIISYKIVEGFGTRLSANGYLDCTRWVVFPTKEEAKEELISLLMLNYEEEDARKAVELL